MTTAKLTARERAIHEEIVRRGAAKQVFDPASLIDPTFPTQNAFFEDKSTFVLAQCSRRAGKSNGIGKRLFRKALKYPGAMCPYFALTRESAYNIMWPVFREINEKYKLGAVLTDSDLTVTLPNEARIVCYGADMKNFINRVRGIKTPEAAVDEGQSFGEHLNELIEDILTPAIADYPDDGAITLTGTPGPVPRGYFYEACTGQQGFSAHKWTILDNPYMPKAREFIDALKIRKKWTDSNPTYMREWLNEWVLDLDALLIRYGEETNHYNELPRGRWNYILGVDIGLRDADALAVVAWSQSHPGIYLVEERITAGQDITLLTNSINEMITKYSPQKIVVDTGGLGAKIAEELRRRKGIPVHAADKARKMENVAFLNEALRLGTFLADKDSRFAKDSYQVQVDWDKTTPDKLVVKDGFHSDIIDAVLYAFKEARTYLNKYDVPLPKIGTPERGQIEAEEFWESEEKRVRKKKDVPIWEREDF